MPHLLKDKGEDLYLHLANYPHELSNVMIDKTEKYKSVEILIRKSISKTIQGQGSDQCLDVTPPEYGSLISQKTMEILSANVSCTMPFTDTLLEDKKLPKCTDKESAFFTFAEVIDKNVEVIQNTSKICSISSYDSKESYFNEVPEDNPDLAASPFTIFIYYGKTTVEEKTEQYIYDPGALLTSIGGNMGLFLGFSCLSCLLSLISFCKERVFRRFFK